MQGSIRRFLMVASAAFFVSSNSFSQSPLTVDDIFTATDRYRINFGINYFNDSDFQPISNVKSNTDIVDASIELSYGYTKNTELSFSASKSFFEERISQFGNRATNNGSGVNQISAGLSHKFSRDNDTPALIGLVRAGYLSNKLWDESTYSGTVGLITYRSYDPILLSMSVVAQDIIEFKVNGNDIKRGLRFNMNPTVSFAVNPNITLTGGLRYQWRRGQEVNGRRIDINTTKTNMEVGLGYHWSNDLSVSLNTNISLSDDSGSNISINFRCKFDDPL